MWQFLVGLLAGAAGVLAKDYFVDKPEQKNKQVQLNSVLAENDKLKIRNKEAEHLIEDLQTELSQIKKQSRSNDDIKDNLNDNLDAEKRKNKRLSAQVSDLLTQIEEYKSAILSLESEIKQLKKN